MQAVEEVPSSSASSVAPSAATTQAVAKTAASIQEFNDEQEPGWITSGTDDLWDELVQDSGSVSTACPYAWCSDISVNNEDKVYLQDIQQFHKMIESGFTLSSDDYKCYMHKGNQRGEIFRKGRIFVLGMRRRWLESKVQMAAPIDEVTAEEMEIDDVGEGARVARAETRVDEHRDEPPTPRPREVRLSSTRSGAEIVSLHNLTHCPFQSWCEVCVASKGRSDHYYREAPQPMDGDVARSDSFHGDMQGRWQTVRDRSAFGNR